MPDNPSPKGGGDDRGGGVMRGIRKIGGMVSKVLGSRSHRGGINDEGGQRWAVDAETGKITVNVQELDFIGTKYTRILFVDRHFDVLPGSDDESLMISSLQNILQILRSNPVHRQLVRKKLFYDQELGQRRKRREDERPLAGNLRQYLALCVGKTSHGNVAFRECVIELLAIYFLGACVDIQQAENKPRKLDSQDPQLMPGLLGAAAAAEAGRERPASPPPMQRSEVQKPKQDELDYAIKSGVIDLLDLVIHDKTVGIDPFCRMTPASQTVCWTMELYRLLMDHDEEVKGFALKKEMVKWCWEVVSRKTRMREPRQERIAAVKLSCSEILNDLGKVSINFTDDQTDEGKTSINMINMNSRSTKEITKLLHNHPRHHPTLLSLLTMIGQKAENNRHLKEQGMMEYLTTKVLPFHSEHHQRCIPHLVILLNSWLIHPEDLDFFWQFNGIQCLVFHLENALSSDKMQERSGDETNWEDMILHGLSILYKLSDRPIYHQKMMQSQAVPVLLESTRQIEPLKSMYHLNAFIAALYSLRNLTAGSIENRRLVAHDSNFLILPHLLSATTLPANCLIHLLFLFSNLTCDKNGEGRADEQYRAVIMNDIFLAVFKPLCVIVQSTQMRKALDDSQITILCLTLQVLATLVGIARQENPLLCIQIEHDLPLQHLSTFTRAKTLTPYPRLANELLSLVYLVP
eukprot:TRINITY_DN12361_c0_g4_i2.p1 TRINITY_DN12361_c0_g4~~TRINITY_DN12361_c0_g4_i2.p1  ORF type:complete len:722 (+),score=234.31 TRINITY_DN12361_c0_g4_i2:96-2168(+)